MGYSGNSTFTEWASVKETLQYILSREGKVLRVQETGVCG